MLRWRVLNLLAMCFIMTLVVEAARDLSKFFNEREGRYDTSTDDGNGCKSRQKDLENSYTEAAKVSDTTIFYISTRRS